MTLQIGDGTVMNGDFSAIDWAEGPYFLKTETDPNGGQNYTIEGTQQLLSVPYALYAANAGNGFSGNYNDLTDKPEIPTVPANLSDFNNDLGLATVATSGSYNDLTNKPTIPTVPANLSDFNNDLGLATVATTGNYNDLTNKPTIPMVPANLSDFNNDLGLAEVATTGDYNDLTNKPTIPTNLSDFNNDLGLATVATTGSYNDLTNRPIIPQVPENLSDFNNDLGLATVATTGNYNDLTNKPEEQMLSISNDTIYLTGGSFVKLPAAAVGFSGDYNDLTNKPTIPTVPENLSDFNNDLGLATVATSGSYSDLSNKPNINNGMLSITQGGSNLGSFNANSSGDVEIEIPAQVNADWNAGEGLAKIYNKPTMLSAFGNDVGYVSFAEFLTLLPQYQTQVDWAETDYTKPSFINNKPTYVSEFTNDVSYVTAPEVPDWQEKADWTETDVNKPSYIKNKPTGVSAFDNDMDYIERWQLDALLAALQHKIDSLSTELDKTNNPCHGLTTVTDYYGEKTYNVVAIGSQCWLKENMEITHFPDATLSLVSQSIISPSTGYCYAPINSIHGLRYNYQGYMCDGNENISNDDTTVVQGICPDGFHIPTVAEYTELFTYLVKQGASNFCLGRVLVDDSWTSTAWEAATNPNMGYNASGFSAFPAGRVPASGSLNEAVFGTTTNVVFVIDEEEFYVQPETVGNEIGRSIRCVRD